MTVLLIFFGLLAIIWMIYEPWTILIFVPAFLASFLFSGSGGDIPKDDNHTNNPSSSDLTDIEHLNPDAAVASALANLNKDSFGNPIFDIHTDSHLIKAYLDNISSEFDQSTAIKLLHQYIEEARTQCATIDHSEPQVEDFGTNFARFKQELSFWKDRKRRADENLTLWCQLQKEYLTAITSFLNQ